MGRKSRKRVSYETDEDSNEEEEIVNIKYTPWSLTISDTFDELLDLNEEFENIDDRFKWLNIGDVLSPLEDMLWDRSYLDNIPEKVEVDEVVLNFSESIINILNLMKNPHVDDPFDYNSDLSECEEEEDGTKYIIPPLTELER